MTLRLPVDVAIETFETTDGDDRTRLLAAIEAYTIALRGAGLMGSTDTRRAAFEDAEAAARWLADAGRHPRYSGDEWRTLLDPGHDLTLAETAVRSRPDTTAGESEQVRAAVALIRAHHAASGAPPC